ncbi:phage terminase large subunit [Mycobacterium sp.]|uniref:phage terminase large subunit n=1 Tax=Mycobacterium sp. TaxID=1785 RepID=UPI003A8C3785
MTFATQLANHLDPPPTHPNLATPTAFATTHSRGTWQPAPHLTIIETAVLEAINNGGRTIISASVRHGKSELVSKWVPAWYLGTHPDRRVILAGHEADFASRWGRASRDILTEHGHEFGVSVSQASSAANRWDLTSPNQGGMLTVGVGGSPIGRGAHLMIVDDPIKSYADAMSPLKRQQIIDWWTGTMVSRIEKGGAVILVMSRWHEHDLAGFLLEQQPDVWNEIRLPAIADDPNDLLGREIGDALWPARFPVKDLLERKAETSLSLGEAVWLAQYQQTPSSPTGGKFPTDKWVRVPAVSIAWNPIRWCRGWDLAATEGGGDYTVGALVGRTNDGRTILADLRRGQWSDLEVEHQVLDTARTDPPGTRIELPQDPGQAGKAQASTYTRLLAGYDVHTAPVTGSKEVRATGWAAQQQAGNIMLVDSPWVDDVVAEHTEFPRGAHDDIVDACASAFNALSDVAPVRSVQYRNHALKGTR